MGPSSAVALAGVSQAAKSGATLEVPPEAKEGLERLNMGDSEAAIVLFRTLQQTRPDHPLGYLLEADARWWSIYCHCLSIKWNTINAWNAAKEPEHEPYLALAEKTVHLAEKQLGKNDSAEMELYAGMGYALQARVHGLRDEKRATARVAVKGRAHLLRALQLNPELADADMGLGLYNYFVDTLSPIVKMLRVFMGIPGGNKREGIQQLETAAAKGELTAVEARFYLARNLRTYDHEYKRALNYLEPLANKYPRNPAFLLLRGDLEGKLGLKEEAAATFHAAEQLAIADGACAQRVAQIARSSIATPR